MPPFTIPHRSRSPNRSVTPEDRYHMIAEAAYFRAEQRGFHGGCPLDDWLAAEREIAQRYFSPAPSLRAALVFLSPEAGCSALGHDPARFVSVLSAGG